MRREVQAFVVKCIFMDGGCQWKGEVRHLEVKYGYILQLVHACVCRDIEPAGSLESTKEA